MGIEIQVQSERGELIVRGGNYSPPQNSYDLEAYPLLSGIDPHGDTIFNRMQAERVVAEAAALHEDPRTEGRPTGLEGIRELYLAHVISPPHRYLWFVGD